MSERRELVVAGLRVAGPAMAIAFLLAWYLHHIGEVGRLAALGIVVLGPVIGFPFGLVVALGMRASGERLIKVVTAQGNLPPAASFSYEESLLARGKAEEALAALEARLRDDPNDLNARLALARLWRDHLGRPDKAEEVYLEARRMDPNAELQFTIANALIDLYRSRGDRGREMAELARFAARFAGTEAGTQARAALRRLKESEPPRGGAR
jgi:tetratricopeptide (TPR) repeat protein